MKKFYRLFLTFLLAGFFLTGVKPLWAEEYIASSFSDRYHLPSCKVTAKIDPRDKVVFASEEEARKAGYEPCGKCQPLTVPSNLEISNKTD